MAKKLFYMVTLLLFSLNAFSLPRSLQKNLLQIYQPHRFTFLCEQAFSEKGEIEYTACKNCPKTFTHVQWMPIVPLQKLAAPMHCYSEKLCIDQQGKRFKGLRCCEQIDPVYQQIVRDLRNYVPEHPWVKRERNNYDFGIISKKSLMNRCHFYIDKEQHLVESAPHLLGMIGRTYLYFHEKYHLPLNPLQMILYSKWDKYHPMTPWEKEREEKILSMSLSDAKTHNASDHKRYPRRL